MVHKPQICKMPNLRKVRKSKKIKSANLRICDLRNLFADHPPLKNIRKSYIHLTIPSTAIFLFTVGVYAV
jgi:hypothetical protein